MAEGKTWNDESIFDASSISNTDKVLALVNANSERVSFSLIKQFVNSGVDILALNNFINSLPDNIENLSSAEITQINNIGDAIISYEQWLRLSNSNQDVNTESSVTFDTLTTTGLINNVDIATLSSSVSSISTDVLANESSINILNADLAGFPDNLKSLTDLEIAQIGNINNSISAEQWAILGSLDQNLQTSDNVSFNNVSVAGSINNINIETLNSNVLEISNEINEFPDSLKLLTTEEVGQLANIGSNAISAAQWQYISGLNQGLRTTDDVTFNNITSALVNGIDLPNLVLDVSNLSNEINEFPDQIKNLSASEISQLENINTSSISEQQWSYVSNLNQDLNSSSNVTFNTLNTVGSINGVNLSDLNSNVNALSIEINAFPDSLKNLTTSEVTQLGNIGGTVISSSKWSYMSTLNQNLRTTDNVAFNNITVSGTVDGINISALNLLVSDLFTDVQTITSGLNAVTTEVNSFPDSLKTLTASEVTQIANIGSTVISSSKWSYMSTLNQNLRTTDNVAFNNITVAGTVDGINVSGLNSIVSTLSTNVQTLTSELDTVTTDLNGFPNALKSLTTSEATQLTNIGSASIDNASWLKLGALNQDVSSSSTPTFDNLNVNSYNPVISATSGNGQDSELRLLEQSTSTYGGVIRYDGGTNRLEFSTYNGGAYTVACYTIRGSASLYVMGSAYKPGGGSWSSSSDRRLKYDIQPVTNALDKICALSGVDFKWKADDEKSCGFIAQDVEKIFPNWVAEDVKTDHDKKANISVDKVKKLTLPFEFNAYIVESIKELRNEISSIKQFLKMEN